MHSDSFQLQESVFAKSKVVIRRCSLDFNTTCTSTCAILLWNAGPCLLKPQISLKTVLRVRLSSEIAY